jgi:membrane fusion protein (multidrug efflux system)
VPTNPTRRLLRRGPGFFPLFAALGLAACGGEPPAAFAPPPVEVGVVDVEPRSLPLLLEYPGQLKGVREVEVRARVSGILLERRYNEGEMVQAGDVLFRIDAEPFRAAVARARAEVGVQEASLGQARRERDRIVPLYDQKLASLRERDTSLATFESAEAAVAAARAALRTAELDLSYTEVRAPIGGLTSREVRSEGSLVTAGGDSSLLTYIVQSDRLYVDIAVADTDADLVRSALAGDAADLVGVQVTDAQGRLIGAMGEIEFVSPRIDDATGTVAIRAVLDNPGGIVPGRIVRAHIEGVSIPDALVIPKRAVMHGAQGPYVWTVDGNGQPTPAPVVLGALAGNDVAVTAGLSAGARVVVDGLLKLRPGQPVNAVPTLSGTAQNSEPGSVP